MDGVVATADVSAIWAALQAQAGGPRGHHGHVDDHVRADDADGDDEDDEEEDDDEEMAPVMPQRVGGGLLPPSFYAPEPPAAAAPFLLPHGHHHSSSELFLDDILRSHDESFGAAHLTDGDGGSGGGRLTAERLSQLEDNYERKKKRAKINRKDLNSRFQELMDLLHLKEDRKLNRAKVLEKAIDHIHKLTDELQAIKAARPVVPQQQQQLTQRMPFAFGGARGAAAMPPMPLPQWPATSAAMAPTALNMATQMMWMPMLPQQQQQQQPRLPVARPSSARASAAKAHAAAARANSVATATIQTQTSPEKPTASASSSAITAVRRPGLKRARDADSSSASTSSSPSTLPWLALEVPTLLELCDAWTLARLMETSRDLRAATRRDALWQRLCERRWKLDDDDAPAADSLLRWRQLHAANEMPRCFCVTGSTLHFASGRAGAVGLWASLVRRSNGRTTRTVLVDGKAAVRQVVELNVLIQNLHTTASLQLTDQLHVVAVASPSSSSSSSSASSSFRLITSDSRAHLMPHLVTVNDVPCGSASVRAVELFHGDFCVLSVFVECDGLDLEQQFLERVDGVTMQCELWTRGAARTVDVAASSVAHKPSLIAASYAADKAV